VADAAKDDPNAGFVDDLLSVKNAALEGLPSERAKLAKLSQDWQVQATLQQRSSALLSREWRVEAGGKRKADQMAADWLREQIVGMAWDSVVEKMLWGNFYGYAVGELLYGRDGRYVSLDAIRVRASSRFRFGGDLALRLVTPQKPKGERMPDRKFWTFTRGAETDDDPYGTGLAHYLYWPVTFKRQGLRAALVYLERFAHPTPIGKYAPGTDKPEVRKLLQALMALTTSGAIVVPDGMTVEKFEASRSGSDPYTAFQNAMDAAISKVVLSQTMTSDATASGLGSNQADVHKDVAEWVVKRDADLIAQSFNAGQGLREGPVEWLTAWNFPEAKPPRFWYLFEEPEDTTRIAERDAKLFTSGGWVRTQESQDAAYGPGYVRAGSPEAEPDAPVAEATKTMGRGAAASFAEGGVGETPEQALRRTLDAEVSGWARQIRDVVETSADYAEAIARLETLFPQLDASAFVAAIEEATLARELAGRADVLREAEG